MDGADGVKTGYTKAAGRILVSSATRADRRLIAVTINAPDDWNDHARLHELGFRSFTTKTVVDAGEILGSLEVVGGRRASVDLVAQTSFSYPLKSDEQVTVRLQEPEFVYAPVAENDFAGYAYICVDGAAVGKVALCYSDTVEQTAVKKKGFLKKLFGD